MSGTPSLRNAMQFAAALNARDKHKPITIACIECKKALWSVVIKGTYGTRVISEETPFPGVPPYSEYWSNDRRTSLNNKCPHCGKDYFKALATDKIDPRTGQPAVFPKIHTLELD